MSHPPEPTLSADTREQVRAIFERSAFVADLGVSLEALGPGWCETSLAIQPRHLQQNDFVHAGVQATLADHTAGAAARTISVVEAAVYAAAGDGEKLTAKATVTLAVVPIPTSKEQS